MPTRPPSDAELEAIRAGLDAWSAWSLTRRRGVGRRAADIAVTDHEAHWIEARAVIENRTVTPERVKSFPRGGVSPPHRAWDIEVAPPEDYRSKTEAISLGYTKQTDGCTWCRRKGEESCSACRGRGETACPNNCNLNRMNGQFYLCSTCHNTLTVRCRTCSGDGRVTCTRCGGSGLVSYVFHYKCRVHFAVSTAHALLGSRPHDERHVRTARGENLYEAGAPDPGTLATPELLAAASELLIKVEAFDPEKQKLTRSKVLVRRLPVLEVDFLDGTKRRKAWVYGTNHVAVVEHPPVDGVRVAVLAALAAGLLALLLYGLGAFAS